MTGSDELPSSLLPIECTTQGMTGVFLFYHFLHLCTSCLSVPAHHSTGSLQHKPDDNSNDDYDDYDDSNDDSSDVASVVLFKTLIVFK